MRRHGVVLRGNVSEVTGSPSGALCRVPTYIWDVNGYYRELGVATDCSRSQLRLAYFAAGGPDDSRLTFVMKQLLNPLIRSEYDQMPFGEIYLDEQEQEKISNRVRAAAYDRMAKHYASEDWSDDVVGEFEREILEEAGFSEKPDNPVLDFPDKTQHDRPEVRFDFGYYQEGSAMIPPPHVLAEWQAAIARHLRREEIQTAFAIGISTRPFPLVQKVGYRTVFFAPEGVENWINLDRAARHVVRLHLREQGIQA